MWQGSEAPEARVLRAWFFVSGVVLRSDAHVAPIPDLDLILDAGLRKPTQQGDLEITPTGSLRQLTLLRSDRSWAVTLTHGSRTLPCGILII